MAKIQYVEVSDLEDFEDNFEPAPRIVAMSKRDKQRDDGFDSTKPKAKKPVRRDRTVTSDIWQPEPIEMPFIRRTNYR